MGDELSKTMADTGHRISILVADAAAQPISQVGILVFCSLWWLIGLPTNVLVATLSILAITLTQMVLNRQKLLDEKNLYRDIAMHVKLDELLRSEEDASKELAGIEELEAEEIFALKKRLAQSRLARTAQSN
jgi:low affinity Fe/Cu permease